MTTRFRYDSYRRRMSLIGAFLASYVVVAVAGNVNSPIGEYYPVFSWSLFSKVTTPVGRVEIMIHALDDERFEPPKPYSELKGHFRMAAVRDSGAVKSAKRLGRAVQTDTNVRAARTVFERRVLEGRNDIEYSIDWVVFDPLDRWYDNVILERQQIARFVSGEME